MRSIACCASARRRNSRCSSPAATSASAFSLCKSCWASAHSAWRIEACLPALSTSWRRRHNDASHCAASSSLPRRREWKSSHSALQRCSLAASELRSRFLCISSRTHRRSVSSSDWTRLNWESCECLLLCNSSPSTSRWTAARGPGCGELLTDGNDGTGLKPCLARCTAGESATAGSMLYTARPSGPTTARDPTGKRRAWAFSHSGRGVGTSCGGKGGTAMRPGDTTATEGKRPSTDGP
mmetsp:Transcript_894/g.1820  ORF Transcript_894/g.1820 Transcript_894/m.1820 type:complete len:239 (+) Transcript_894:842-1558(+)